MMIDLTADSDDDAPRATKRGVVDLTADSEDEPQPKKRRPDTSGDAEFARALAAGSGDDWRRRAPAPLPAPAPAAKAAKAPPWEGKRGTQRMFAEFRALQKWEGSPRVYDAEMVMDQANAWRCADIEIRFASSLPVAQLVLGVRRGKRRDVASSKNEPKR